MTRGLFAAAYGPGQSNSVSNSRGHPARGRRENSRASATESAQSAHRPGEKCLQFHSISHLVINELSLEFAVTLLVHSNCESPPGGNLILPSQFFPCNRSSPATLAAPKASGQSNVGEFCASSRRSPRSTCSQTHSSRLGWQRREGCVERVVVVVFYFWVVQSRSSTFDPSMCFKLFFVLANSHTQIRSDALPC